tara:strand:+ start:11 stop:1183 length:1173 start_codon:yes stop_codon:yes gene_type:complete
MSTVKVNAIRSTSGSSDAITLNSSSGVTAINGNGLRAQNLVQNGAMNVAQRGVTSTVSGYGSVDRWKCIHGGTDEAPTQAQHALTSSDTGPWAKGFRNSFHITNGNQTGGAGAADYIGAQIRLEAQDIAYSGWDYTNTSSKITLSFWVKSSVAQNFYGFLKSLDGTQKLYPFETGSLTADTWTKITKTITGHADLQFDLNSEQGFQINISAFWGTDYTASGVTLNAWATYASGTRTPDSTSTWYTTDNSTFEITGVQLEVGPTASEYMHESYAETLDKCQRYYFKTFNQGTTPANGLEHNGEIQHLLNANAAPGDPQENFYFPRPMNHAPDVTLYNPRPGGTAGQWGSNTSDSSNARAFGVTEMKTIIDNTDTNLSATYWRIAFTADAEL